MWTTSTHDQESVSERKGHLNWYYASKYKRRFAGHLKVIAVQNPYNLILYEIFWGKNLSDWSFEYGIKFKLNGLNFNLDNIMTRETYRCKLSRLLNWLSKCQFFFCSLITCLAQIYLRAKNRSIKNGEEEGGSSPFWARFKELELES